MIEWLGKDIELTQNDTIQEAQKAIDKLHDRVFRGKSLVVTPASVVSIGLSLAMFRIGS